MAPPPSPQPHPNPNPSGASPNRSASPVLPPNLNLNLTQQWGPPQLVGLTYPSSTRRLGLNLNLNLNPSGRRLARPLPVLGLTLTWVLNPTGRRPARPLLIRGGRLPPQLLWAAARCGMARGGRSSSPSRLRRPGRAPARGPRREEVPRGTVLIDVLEGDGKRSSCPLVARRAGMPEKGYQLPFAARLKNEVRPTLRAARACEDVLRRLSRVRKPSPMDGDDGDYAELPTTRSRSPRPLRTVPTPWVSSAWASHASPDFHGQVAMRFAEKSGDHALIAGWWLRRRRGGGMGRRGVGGEGGGRAAQGKGRRRRQRRGQSRRAERVEVQGRLEVQGGWRCRRLEEGRQAAMAAMAAAAAAAAATAAAAAWMAIHLE